ncbi:hypothetical protein RhiirA1_481251 [Rhizophagus irregularis]|uniref:Uncharacterized protein n=2 Tax=Rhizophagus irregularis TaxID=588596 RepID=A0A2N0QNC0_9GLOM|nr:hypothetical protein RhiirA1_481251 [Rhizophagus irregularis]GBC29845.2 hypothetical protein GLOIN_2v1778645 [Rhizophagus irregularis DAOM 181602=DAOM 197198]
MFFKNFSISAGITAFQHVYLKIAGSFQIEQDQQEKNDMSFELDHNDTDSADEDSDFIDIKITTPPQMPSRRKRKMEKKTKNGKGTEEEAMYIITGYQPTGLALANINDIILYNIPST